MPKLLKRLKSSVEVFKFIPSNPLFLRFGEHPEHDVEQRHELETVDISEVVVAQSCIFELPHELFQLETTLLNVRMLTNNKLVQEDAQ